MGLIILGIDPGTVVTGYGVIEVSGNNVICRTYGVIRPQKNLSFGKRIHFINSSLKEIYISHKPHHTAIEKVFFGKNPDTAFKLGHIFALCLLQSEKQGSKLFEYASRFVKKTVTFSGRASKELVRQFVANAFSLTPKGPLDGTDALAVALCHSREYGKTSIRNNLKTPTGKPGEFLINKEARRIL